MNPTTYTPDPDPTAPSRNRGRFFAAVAAFAAFGIGLAAGGPATEATSASPAEVVTETVTEPAEVVTETVTEPAETVTETETVERTPQVCVDFIATARQANDLSSRGFFAMSDAIDAYLAGDFAGVEQANADLEAMNGELEALVGPFNAQAAACEAGS